MLSTYMPIEFEKYKVRYGYRIQKKIRDVYGKNVFIFLFRGATGDVYLANSLIPEYIKEHNIEKYVFIGDGKSLREISLLFGVKEAIPLKRWPASCFQSYYRFWGQKNDYMLDLFMWQHTLYFNRCRVRMLETYTFMDTYQHYVFGFENHRTLTKPSFENDIEQLNKKWKKLGIVKGKTIIISSQAYSVTGLSSELWKNICSSLNNIGWNTLFCINPKKDFLPFPNAKTIWFPYRESVPLLEYAGGFLGVRSGLCDIVSSANCKMTILYPLPLKEHDYSEHRSDKFFCGLKSMGLRQEVTEIETNLLKNIEYQDNKYINSSNKTDVHKLIAQICNSFS